MAVMGRFQRKDNLGLLEHISEIAIKMSAPCMMPQGSLFFQP